MTSKASKASKTGKGSKTKDTSEQVPTEVTPPAPQTIPGRVERKGGKSRTAQGSTSEAKFKYRAPEPTFEHPQQYHWEGINLNPGDNHQTPGNKYIDWAKKIERQSKPVPQFTLEPELARQVRTRPPVTLRPEVTRPIYNLGPEGTYHLTLTRRDTPPPNYQSITMAEGGNPVEPDPTAPESLEDLFFNQFF